jgi:hypothetical protein
VTSTAWTVAALLAFIAWVGLVVQFDATFTLEGSLDLTLVALLWYFTITTNLLVAVFFTGIENFRQPIAEL